MPKFIIERDINDAGSLTTDELQGISQKSCSILKKLGTEIQWVESYVTKDKVYCVYIAPNEELIKESYNGSRPAPGYPACPDHLEKKTLWELLKVEEEIGVQLTESLAMWPAAAVSGYYFAHPDARYFGLGKIKEDQLLDYSKRRKIPLQDAKKWLNPNLT